MPIQGMPIVGLLEPLYTLFGWMMRLLNAVLSNYGWSIVILTVFLRTIMIPLYVKNHKTQLKQMQLTDELNELRRYYGDDKQGFQMAQMELFKKHKISMMGGCLPSLLGLILLWPIWRIISQPLHYIMGITLEQLTKLGEMLSKLGLMNEAALANLASQDIPVLSGLRQSGQALSQAVSEQLIRADQLINLDFYGLDLGIKPSFMPGDLFGPQWKVYLPLFLIPILAVVTTVLTTKATQWTSPTYLQSKLSKELAKKNPARDVIQDQTEGMMKSMSYMMPAFTLITVFTMPAAMGIYWIVGNVMMIFQSYLFYWLYTKPVMEKLREQNALELFPVERK